MLDQVTVINFAGTPIHRRLASEFESLYARQFGDYHCYTAEWLAKQPFYRENSRVFRYVKYHGYFLWKPFIIQQALKAGAEIVLYCDTNLRFTNFVSFEWVFRDLIEREGVFFTRYPQHKNSQWTKRDAFVLMDADDRRYWEARQLWTVILGFSQQGRSLNILEDYLNYCRNIYIVTEEPNTCGLPDLHDFEAHRWEQSILSILAERYGVGCADYMQIHHWIDKIYPDDLLRQKAATESLAVRDV